MINKRNLRSAVLVAGVCLTTVAAEAQTFIQVGPGPVVQGQVQGPRRWGRPPARSYAYGARAYTAELGDLMVQQANAACVEMHEHYQHNRGFQQTYAATYKLLEDSQHITTLIKQNYHRQSARKDDHIARDLFHMDQLFDQVEDDIGRWTARNGARRHDDTLSQILNDFEATLDNLMTDYGVKNSYNRRRRAVIVTPPTTAVIVPPAPVVVPQVRVVTPPARVYVPTPSVNIIVPRRDRDRDR